MSSKNYRKITVGDDFSNCIAYVKGKHYLRGTIQITNILPSETFEDFFDIYIKKEDETASTIWKTVPKNKVLEVEYDINFE